MNIGVKTSLRLSALSMALIAAGCGGGGSNSSISSNDNLTVQGVASKGIIKKGLVEVFSLDAQGAKSAKPVATTMTADDGSYSVKISKDVLNFIVEVSAADGATMADEATGQDIPVPSSMKLRNVVALSQASEAVYTGHVSPLTEMEVQTAEKSSGGLSAANVARAKAGVTVLLGFDPEKVKPINSNSSDAKNASEEEKLQSLTLAAISKMALDQKLDCTQTAASDRVACVVNKVAASANLNGDKLELNETLRSEVRAALVAVTANDSINQTGKGSIEGTASFAQSSVPASSGAVAGLQAAKQLVASLRNTGNALSNESNSGALDVRANTMKRDFDKAIAPLDPQLLAWMKIIPDGIDLFVGYKAGIYTDSSRGVFAGDQKIGGCTVYSDDKNSTKATAPSNAVTVGCSTYGVPVPDSYVTTSSTGYSIKVVDQGITLTPSTTQPSTYGYKARARMQTIYYSGTGQATSTTSTIGNYGTDSSARATGTISYTMSGSALTGFSVTGMMPARVDLYGNALTDYGQWDMNFTRTDEGNSLFKYALAGDFTSIKDGVASGKVSVGDGSFVRLQEDSHGNIVENGLKEFTLQLFGEAEGSKIAGSLTLANFKTDKNGYDYSPTKVTFNGTLASNSAEFFAGTLTAQALNYDSFYTTEPESSTNFIKKSVAVVGKITIPNRPVLTLTIDASNNTFDTTDANGQYSDGTIVVNMTATNRSTGKTLTISSADGASVAITPGQETAVLVKDNVNLATINLHTGVINYVDGSLESLK